MMSGLLCLFVVFLALFEVSLSSPIPGFQGAFNNNYSYKTFHTYSYEFSGNPPRPAPQSGQFIVERGIPNGNFPMNWPSIVQEQIQHQIPRDASQNVRHDFPQNLNGAFSQNVPYNFNFPTNQNLSPNNYFGHQNQHQNNFSQNNFPLNQRSKHFNQQEHPENLKQRTENVPVPQANIIIQPGARKSREDNPTTARSETSTVKLTKSLPIKGTNCTFGFCEDVENYPEQLVKALLERNAALQVFFRPKAPDIGERFNSEFENLCNVRKFRITPKTGTNVDGIKRVIMNIDGYKQVVDAEECRQTQMQRSSDVRSGELSELAYQSISAEPLGLTIPHQVS